MKEWILSSQNLHEGNDDDNDSHNDNGKEDLRVVKFSGLCTPKVQFFWQGEFH